MQHARQLSRQTVGAPRKRPRLRAAAEQDAQGAASPARELQAALHVAYDPAVPVADEPDVPVWPGWARLAVVAGGAAVCWAAVIGVARLLLDG